jgi:hypothetical protein
LKRVKDIQFSRLKFLLLLSKDQFSVRKIGVLVTLICILISFYTLIAKSASHPNNPKAIFSSQAEPELSGPENLCIVFGGVVGTYTGGGDPNTDIYSWLVTSPTGEVLYDRSGGSQFQNLQVSFNAVGRYIVSLSVRRGTEQIYDDEISVEVLRGPELAILPDYVICGESSVKLTAINPETSNLNAYSFIWTDQNGNVIGNENDLIAFTEGFYSFEIFLTSGGGKDCLITGTTFVGPALDFKINQSATSVCEGQSIRISTDTPLIGEYFIKKQGQSTSVSLGSAFNILIESGTLQGPGIYEVIFSAIDPNIPGCTSDRKIAFEIRESPKIQATILARPDDCNELNGSFQVTSLTNLDSIRVDELGFLQSSTLPGQVFTFSNLKPQVYTIRFFENGCESTNLLILDAKDPPASTNPPNQVPISFGFLPEDCFSEGITPGKLNLAFPDGDVNGDFRILSSTRGVVFSGELVAQDSLSIDLFGGTYLLELIIDGCTYPVQEFSIARKPLADFTVPDLLNICEQFELKPETSQDLLFTLTYPDGSSKSLGNNEPFVLTEAGDYSLLGEPANPASGVCPKTQTFKVTLSTTISFEPILLEEDCFGNKIYQAKIDGVDPDLTSIRWLNEEGIIVGRSILLSPPTLGVFQLIVQPLESGFCPVNPVSFEINAAVLTVPMDLEANKICPEPGVSKVVLKTNTEEVSRVEWIFYDLSNNRSDLTQFDDALEIEVSEEGTYEVVAYNRLGCEIGRNLIAVTNSTLLDLPELPDRYIICSKKNTVPPLDPGEYQAYEWYYEETLVSQQRLFKPSEVGTYTLQATTIDGCVFEKSFTTIDGCDFEVVYPNAMVLGDSERDFRVLVSEGVDEVDVYIINRQGALIHFESLKEIQFEMPILNWDGRYQGQYVPNGTYAVVLILRNTTYGVEEKLISSLFVVY